jgi:probable phosphoglycerate mutase
VVVVCHQVVVLCMRYVLEELDEQQILAIDKQAEVLNCGICAYDFEPDAGGLCIPTLALWNHGTPLEADGAEKTSAPDAMAGSR